ncbi:glycosyltransferase [Neobacillus sp. GCM10023253]|uniref:glycosyltransferase n=1 Tax=Neobacillus sp. GCM10023253 TaxID=3252644 RepID=UPI003617104C
MMKPEVEIVKKDSLKINWIGPQFAGHSLAIVNRNICSLLNKEHFNIRKKVPDEEIPLALSVREEQSKIGELLPFPESDFTVVHQWPPVWDIPKSKKWICMQPWEFGAIPRTWYIPMKYWVDEIWVYSQYNKESYVRCGIPEDKIHVIPLGVDEKVFHTDVEPLDLTPSSFRFLFVGGTIGRKGIDTLIQAYLNEFSANDDVCLFIKDTGTQSFYKGITLEKMIHEAMLNPKNPRIVYMDHDFSETELAGLYKACDCLVHPYRGEGFGLPIAESMACGIPAIVPDKGSCRDFCSAETAFLVPSKEVLLSEKKVGDLDTVDYPWWLSIDRVDLQQTMRFAYENPSLVNQKGQEASRHILASFTWKKSAQTVAERIRLLADKKTDSKLTHEDIVKMELEYGNELYQNKLMEDALNNYLNILSIYPLTLMARYNAVIIHIQQKNYVAAIEHLEYIADNMEQQDHNFQENILLMKTFCNAQL